MSKVRRLIATVLVVTTTGLAMPLPAQAAMVATDTAVAAVQRDRIAHLLDRADVRSRLEGYGVSRADVEARVAAMTDQEVDVLARHIDSLPAGGFIEAILFVFVLLLLTDILGFTKVFPFTRSIR